MKTIAITVSLGFALFLIILGIRISCFHESEVSKEFLGVILILASILIIIHSIRWRDTSDR